MVLEKKDVLIIGSGGREHALGWKLQQSSKVGKIYFAPGNGGTEQIGENVAINALDIKPLLDFALEKKIDLTVVGPDDALALGMVDTFQKKGLKIFGPTKQAAKLEWSKSFAKKFMQNNHIPTANYATFNDSKKAKRYITSQKLPLVIKASGLALGKGVIIAKTQKDAFDAVENIMVKRAFGDAGNEVVVEEYLEGREISIHVFSDGENISLLPTCRDHKRLLDENEGPITGGMGTIAPLKEITKQDLDLIKQTIVLPVIKRMQRMGKPFSGLLYPGIMMTKKGPKVLEFNSRFGDPETQTYMRLLKTDLFEIIMACVNGNLKNLNIEWENQYACCIALTAKGYPEMSKKGDAIFGIKEAEKNPNIVIFYAGTKNENNNVYTNGGRVLGVTATGKTLQVALSKAYSVIGDKGIHFKGMQYRLDIGRI